MSYMETFYPESRFGGFTDVDGTLTFYVRVNALLKPSDKVLDVGCGRGAVGDRDPGFVRDLRILRGKVSKIIGIDVDPNARHNPLLDEFRIIDDASWPVEDCSIDLLVCDWVLEHVENVELFFSEARRVLKPGGKLCIRTSNSWSYVSILSRVIPERLHLKVISYVQKTRSEEDVFPTYTLCNTVPAIRKRLKEYGFQGVVYGHHAEPGYLGFSRLAYGLGVLLHRITPRLLGHALFVFAERSG